MIASWTQPKTTINKAGTATTTAPRISSWADNPPVNKFGQDVSTHPYNPLNPKNVLGSPQPTPKLNTAEKLSTGLTNMLPGATQTVHDIGADPLSVKKGVSNILPDMWNAIKDPVGQEALKIGALISGHKYLSNKPMTNAEAVGTGAEAIAGVGNVLFSPLTALFNGANDVPILGTVSRLITLPFSAVGDAGAGIANGLVQKLPLSQDTKDKIKPGVEQIFALAGQIALGKAGIDAKVWDGLKAKFGETDATTIVHKAQELAAQNPKPASEAEFTTKPVPEAPVALKTAPTKAITPESPLIQEAKKYKSAEEFVKGQGIPKELESLASEARKYKTADEFRRAFQLEIKHGDYWHITDNPNFKIDPNLGPRDMSSIGLGQMDKGKLMVTSQPDLWAESYAGSRKYAAKLDFSQVKPEDYTQVNRGFGNEFFVKDPSKVRVEKVVPIDQALKEHAIVNKALDKNIKSLADLENFYNKATTKSQLTDIWNKANETETGKITKAASDINENLVKKGFDSIPESEQAKYTTTTKADQIAKITDFMTKNLEEAKGAATGDLPIPHDILPQPLFNAMEEYATKNNDVQLLRDLAKSPLATQLSEAGQTLGSHGFNDNPNSAVAAIRDVAKARETKTAGKVKDTVAGIKKEISKTHTKETWSSFVDSLKC